MAEKIRDSAKQGEQALKFTDLVHSPKPEKDDLSEEALATVLAGETLKSDVVDPDDFENKIDNLDNGTALGVLERLTKTIEKKKAAIKNAEANSVAFPIPIAGPSDVLAGSCNKRCAKESGDKKQCGGIFAKILN